MSCRDTRKSKKHSTFMQMEHSKQGGLTEIHGNIKVVIDNDDNNNKICVVRVRVQIMAQDPIALSIVQNTEKNDSPCPYMSK